ncbi:MogA/MoaB family molybdenum cofactor biosynthesis protein [Tessaracoccus caeni]|uniref:MogA/MoaB family molybdenum cofactor biosynthesis protein n=1 Tax=Tessaracoccus caeni TaxID=3031239 RepID=UPI0023DCA4D6|nr:MogA/MoaB family molybdenum cofactor biosynthesis protein [Tessaracoccus caeni]MDF1487618.1 MogA/MoaB family molybdenum cofactor biosynthesis protein [Tessaracoccus caeni]
MISYKAAVITCSDRAAADVYEDRSGPVLRDALAGLGFDVAEAVIVPDDVERIADEIEQAIEAGARVIMTTGGTGVGPRDVTVEATLPLIDYQLPGLMEEVRRRGAEKTTKSLLSRGVAGVVSLLGYPRALVINAPGSRGGARDTIAVVGDLLHHIVDQLDGADHDMD